LNARYSLTDNLDLNYVGGYNDTKYYTKLNFDFAGIGEANNFARYIDTLTKRKVYSNELRLQSNGDGFYNFIYGVFRAKREDRWGGEPSPAVHQSAQQEHDERLRRVYDAKI
jgi:hypothetical protein